MSMSYLYYEPPKWGEVGTTAEWGNYFGVNQPTEDQKETRSTTVCHVGVGGQKRKRINFSLSTPLPFFICISLFSASFFLTASHHISVSVLVCMTLSLLYVSGLSSRVLIILGRILSGPASVTCTPFRNIILYLACRLLALSLSPWLGNDFPMWRCLHQSNGVFQSTEPP